MLKCCTYVLEQIPAEKKRSALGGWGGYADWVSSPESEKQYLCKSFADKNIGKIGATADEYYKVIDWYCRERDGDWEHHYALSRVAEDLSTWREIMLKKETKKK